VGVVAPVLVVPVLGVVDEVPMGLDDGCDVCSVPVLPVPVVEVVPDGVEVVPG
jgi:hypothetical protein